jgi:hypothetical protein
LGLLKYQLAIRGRLDHQEVHFDQLIQRRRRHLRVHQLLNLQHFLDLACPARVDNLVQKLLGHLHLHRHFRRLVRDWLMQRRFYFRLRRHRLLLMSQTEIFRHLK